MRGFQKGITLCSRTSGSALKVMGGVGWWGGGVVVVVPMILVSLKSKSYTCLDLTRLD